MQMVDLLSLLSATADSGDRRPFTSTDRPKRMACWVPVRKGPHKVIVTLVERSTESTATIAWRDSTHCCYGDQGWRASRSRVEGVCAMSGRAINPNDAVF